MLSMPETDTKEAADHTTQIRHGSAMRDKIELAAAMMGVKKSVFLRWAIERQCAHVIEEQQRHRLTKEDSAAFAAALDAPVVISDRARKAAQAFAARVGHAD